MTASKPSIAPSPVIIPGIDPQGRLYPIEKLAAHQQAAFHLAISVFIFSGPLLLIQKRAAGKYHSGGLWANTCCSHPHWGEDVVDCAQRRLREELGIAVPLVARRVEEYTADVGGNLHENERVHMFRGEADHRRLNITPDPAEVAETQWITPTELRDRLAREPETFTTWFRLYVERYPDLSF